MKKTIITLSFLIIFISAPAAQNVDGNFDFATINDYARSSNRDTKLIALNLLEEALAEGADSNEIYTILDYLALEGTQYRTTGLVMNDQPDLRQEAVKYLGQLGTTEALNTLIRVTQVEKELLVIYETVKALGIIGINNKNQAVNAITMIFNKYQQRMPDNRLAILTIEAIDKIGDKNNGIEDRGAIRLLSRIAQGPFHNAVKDHARQTIQNLLKYALRESN